MRQTLCVLALLTAAGSVNAKVVDNQANGFEVSETVEIGAPADKVWDALGQIGSW